MEPCNTARLLLKTRETPYVIEGGEGYTEARWFGLMFPCSSQHAQHSGSDTTRQLVEHTHPARAVLVSVLPST